MDWVRLIVAIALTTVGWAGLVVAGGYTEIRDAPAEWSMPMPQPGDRGAYHLVHVRDTPEGPVQVGPTLPLFRFHFDALSTHDMTGEPVHALIMRAERAHMGNYQLETHDWEFRYTDTAILSTNRDLLRYGGHFGQGFDPEWVLPELVEHQEEGAGDLYFWWEIDSLGYWGGGPCPIIHGMQGTTFATDRVQPFSECTFGGGHVDPTNTRGATHQEWENMTGQSPDFYAFLGDSWKAAGVVELDGVETLVLEQDGPADIYDGTLDIWVQQDNPYVVRAEERVPDERGLRRIWILSEYEPGAPSTEPLPPPAPPIETTPMRSWGPDETGWPYWPPSEAHAAMMESHAADWFERHPNAELVGVRWNNDDDGRTQGQTWAFRYLDGQLDQVIRVRQSTDKAFGPVPFGYDQYVPDMNERVEVSYAQPWSSPSPPGSDTWPTLASILARDAVMGGLDELRSISMSAGARYDIGTGDFFHELATDGVPTERQGWDSHSSVWFWNGTRSAVTDSAAVSESEPVGATEPTTQAPVAAEPDVVWEIPQTRWIAATGGSMALVGLLVYFWPHLKGLAVGLFSRIRPDAVLEHPVRQQIHDLVEADPGIHTQELVRALGSGYGNTQHHLDKLVAAGTLVRHQGKGYACYFPRKTDRRVIAAAPALRSDTARAVLRAIQAEPGTTGGRLAEAVGINRGTLSHHVKRLEEAGVIDGQRDGRAIRYWPTDVAAMLDAGAAA